ncbi:uncharacterized protein EV422DRAFT_566445 [Fimicolochytrium jonesii]|uniref:uncharacterized protein n=1 Tax=Fimicolochytrium jonesii TaxID=1396493 RepID=UPI0022FEB07E|nr:uncharacterized protein EV422DRAFT_566445 [Fimicolochytrium jonesii]KAI8822018.1 hypothetical protein EV422DRAFT_566445 [Fimicolochytrium jonesii]
MPLRTVTGYTDEAIRQSRELLSFYKKRQEIEAGYGIALANLCKTYRRTSIDESPAAAKGEGRRAADDGVQILESTVWGAAFCAATGLKAVADAHTQTAAKLQANVIDPLQMRIRDMKTMRLLHLERSRMLNRQLQEVYTECRRAKQEYDKSQETANEAVDAFSKAQLRAEKKKELERLQAKATAAIDRVSVAADALRTLEEKKRTAQQEYFEEKLPQFYSEIRRYEEKRLNIISQALKDVADLDDEENAVRLTTTSETLEVIQGIDVQEDIAEFDKLLELAEKAFGEVSVRSLVGALKGGRVSIKRGDTSSGWNNAYLVLMAEDELLYCFDSEDSEQPREVITLGWSQVYSVDDSYFGRANCFQLMFDQDDVSTGNNSKMGTLNNSNSKGPSRMTYNFIAESANDKHEWIHALRKFGYCCETCASAADDGDAEGVAPMQQRSLQLWVMEAKEMKAPSTSALGPVGKSINPYCIVLLNDVKQARTSVKSDDSPFWGEEFRLSDISPCRTRLRLLFFGSSPTKLQKNMEVGYVSINLSRMPPNKRVEEWYHIRPFGGDKDAAKDRPATVGSVRIAYKLTNEQSLPMGLYEELLSTVTEPTMTCVQFIGERITKPQPREELAITVLNILVAFNRDVQGLQTLTRMEIAKTADPNIMFRGNSITTKILDQYMKMVGQPYLRGTLQSLIKGVYAAKESCEVDPSRLPSGRESETVKRNWKRLLNHVTIFWEAIHNSAIKCPAELVDIFHDMMYSAETRFPKTNVKYSAVSGFIFLRFFCPAILSPKLFGITADHPPDPAIARTLTLIAKILQNLANLSEFEGKEPHMAPCNSWITTRLDGMKHYIEHISGFVTGAPRPPTSKPRINLRREGALLHQCINDAWEVILPAIRALQPQSSDESNHSDSATTEATDAAATSDNPLIRLIPIVEKLNAATEEQSAFELGRTEDHLRQSGVLTTFSALPNFEDHGRGEEYAYADDIGDGEEDMEVHNNIAEYSSPLESPAQQSAMMPVSGGTDSPTQPQSLTRPRTPISRSLIPMKSKSSSSGFILGSPLPGEGGYTSSFQEGVFAGVLAAIDDADANDAFGPSPTDSPASTPSAAPPGGPSTTPSLNRVIQRSPSYRSTMSRRARANSASERSGNTSAYAVDTAEYSSIRGRDSEAERPSLPPKDGATTSYLPSSSSTPTSSSPATPRQKTSSSATKAISNTLFTRSAKVGAQLKSMLGGKDHGGSITSKSFAGLGSVSGLFGKGQSNPDLLHSEVEAMPIGKNGLRTGDADRENYVASSSTEASRSLRGTLRRGLAKSSTLGKSMGSSEFLGAAGPDAPVIPLKSSMKTPRGKLRDDEAGSASPSSAGKARPQSMGGLPSSLPARSAMDTQ